MKLVTESELESSCIVANNRMNRERVAIGSNGYETDIRLNPIEFLIQKHQQNGQVAWLDLCCGRGKAIIETGQKFFELGLNVNTGFVGVDLVGMFDPVPDELDFVRLVEASLHQWTTTQAFDLITCVHGLHYVGDKLGLINRAISMLRPNGSFFANIDPSNLQIMSGKSGIEKEIDFDFAKYFNQFLDFDKSSKLLSFTKNENISSSENPATSATSLTESPIPKLQFVGANDQAGPNYTGQPAVNSHYQIVG